MFHRAPCYPRFVQAYSIVSVVAALALAIVWVPGVWIVAVANAAIIAIAHSATGDELAMADAVATEAR